MEALKLMHADLCSAISLGTPGGKRYFMLLVNDYNCYMWAVMLPSKDVAVANIKHFIAATETGAAGVCTCSA